MDLFEILSKNERILVLSDDEERVIYTWNQSLTLQAWAFRENTWEEINVRTLSDKPECFEAAKDAAVRWLYGL